MQWVLDVSINLYVMLDFKLRTAAKYFENIFGKTIKNIRNHKQRKQVARPEIMSSFKNGYPFWKELFPEEMRKPR